MNLLDTQYKQVQETHGLLKIQEDGTAETFALSFSFADQR
jgi:hypothetical protein